MICPVCYRSTGSDDFYHRNCSKKLFGSPTPPLLSYNLSDMNKLAENIIRSSFTVTGVQPKLSLTIENTGALRLTLVGLWGEYILKPPYNEYPELPENESVTMIMAKESGLPVVPNALIHLGSGELAYITRRIDRVGSIKLAMEDMCQLSERLTEDKYKGSAEQIGKIIRKYSSNPGFDLVTFFESAVFNFIIGNSDMHLKNFSLITSQDGTVSLAPFYDLLSTHLVMPEDKEESALTINGKKSKLTIDDFFALSDNLGIPNKAAVSSVKRIIGCREKWERLLQNSYLSDGLKVSYYHLITERLKRLSI